MNVTVTPRSALERPETTVVGILLAVSLCHALNDTIQSLLPAIYPVLKETFKTLHVSLNYILLALVSLHVLAAIKHQLLDRDGLLSRMLPFAK